MSAPSTTSVEAAGPPTLLVTGASSGIGRATAIAAARRGWRLALLGRDEDSLHEAADDCRAQADDVLVVPADVGHDADVARAVGTVVDRWGRLDHVVNSAGVVAYGRTEEIPPEVFEAVLRTNLIGSVNVARHVLPVLRAQRRGALALVGSVIGHISVPGMTPYVLSKWGVRALAHQLRLENRDQRGIRVLYVAPGGVDTPIYRQAANYQGFAGRPPPPVSSAERAGRQVLARLVSDSRGSQLSVANHALRFGHTALPRVYDALVGPLYPVGATALDEPLPADPGNVLHPRPEGNRVDGEHGPAALGLARNLRLRLAGRRPGAGRGTDRPSAPPNGADPAPDRTDEGEHR